MFAWASMRRQHQDNVKRREALRQQEVARIQQEEATKNTEAAVPFPTNQQEQSNNPNQNEFEQDVQNYALSDDQLLEKWQGREAELIQLIANDSREIVDCLKNNLCDQQPDPNEPYFDPHNTPKHSLLERQLGLLIRFREQGSLNPGQISNEQLEEALDIENTNIQTSALELRVAAGIDDDAYSRLLGRSPSLLPQASATSLALLNNESRQSQQRRDQLIATAEALLRSDDQMRAIEMAKRIQYIAPDRSELERLSTSTCQLLPQNRGQVQHHLSIAAEGVGANLNFNCQ